MGKEPVSVNMQFTPNPNTLKFAVNSALLPSGAANFTQAQEAEHVPLAKELFALDGVEAVMVGTNFLAVTKKAESGWGTLAEQVQKKLEEFLNADRPIFEKTFLDALEKKRASASGADSAAENKIREILDNEIRPAVAQDGGDITFEGYEDGVLYLQLRGACSSCPGATMTLKMGVEQRLKQDVPELKEVIPV